MSQKILNTDSNKQDISYESQLKKLKPTNSLPKKRSLEYRLSESEYQEIQTLPYENIVIKPIEKYRIVYSSRPELILFVDEEENIEIQVLVEKKFFIKRLYGDDTILSKPVPINLKNANEKALYKEACAIQYNYNHSLSCLII